ncbi:MAG: 4Fe-4S dicluster domain-containing protein, partial [Prevotellaceae bacterium]|nr:4Fe-4S dicluster domain-containing protein [Prevotellaceae bacterium]
KKFSYKKNHTILRYSLLVITILAWIVGVNAVVSLLDPYGAFGRIASNLMRPVYYMVNNIIASIYNAMGDYNVYRVTLKTVNISSVVAAGVTFIVIGVMSVMRGRLYCNSICPVGTGLGLLSKFSLFKIKLDENSCIKCGRCAVKCKSSCIDVKSKQVDYTRCVSCYSCLDACNDNAIHLKFVYKRSTPDSKGIDVKKRKVMAAGALALAALPLNVTASKLGQKAGEDKISPTMPPGAKSTEHFQRKCTACHLCVSKCPSQVLKPSFLEYGLAGMLQPYMDYRVGFCSYDCTACADVCPNSALERITMDDKHNLQIGKAIFDKHKCVVYVDETDCGACSEHCPTQAVHMVPYKDGLRIPEVDESLCVGCGGCQYICPVTPRQAIVVQGHKKHVMLSIEKEVKREEVKVDDFGF